jgi:predicted DCC family thiol-disulfide oxidoreductase YuxK
MGGERVVVFDGYCHICSGGVRFVMRHPVHPPFELVPMQSDRGRRSSAHASIRIGPYGSTAARQ